MKKKKSVFRKLLFILLGLLGLLVFITYMPMGSSVDSMLKMKRDEEGRMKVALGEEGSGFNLHAVVSSAVNSLSSTSHTTSRGQWGCFAARRVWVMSASDHCLVRKIGRMVLQKVAGLPFVDEAVYVPYGQVPETCELMPELVITLDLLDIEEFRLPGGFKLEAQVSLDAGPAPWDSAYVRVSPSSPPVANVHMTAVVDHDGTYIGLLSAGAKYKPAAESITGSLWGSLEEKKKEWSRNLGTLPDLPACFFGEAAEHADLPFAGAGIEGIEPVGSGAGLFAHNRAIWRFQESRDPVELFAEIEKELVKKGWQDQSVDKKRVFQMSSGNRELYIYKRPDPPRSFKIDIDQIVNGMESTEQPEKGASDYCMVYCHSFSRDEIVEAIERFFESGARAKELIVFFNNMTTSQKERVMKLIEENPPDDPALLLALADYYHKQLKDDLKAGKALTRAAALLYTLKEYQELQKKIRELAKKLGDESLADPPVEELPGLFEEMGIAELTPGAKTEKMEIRLNEQVCFFAKGKNGDLKVECLRVTPDISGAAGDGRYMFERTEVGIRQNGRSYSSGAQSFFGNTGESAVLHEYSRQLNDEITVAFKLISVADNPERFILEVRTN